MVFKFWSRSWLEYLNKTALGLIFECSKHTNKGHKSVHYSNESGIWVRSIRIPLYLDAI